ncbi:MAG: KH domain-containing protein [Patescibacteria group bacterium]
MKDTLTYLVTAIVDHPEDVVIDERNVEDMIVFTIHVHQEDMGKIIGKSGRIIRAIRDLIKILAAKKNLYVDVEIAEDNKVPAS